MMQLSPSTVLPSATNSLATVEVTVTLLEMVIALVTMADSVATIAVFVPLVEG